LKTVSVQNSCDISNLFPFQYTSSLNGSGGGDDDDDDDDNITVFL
jgi:hypothetical protein